MPVYRSWLGDEASRLSASFENGENGGTTLSANSWTDLLAACVARAVWIEPQIPARFFADHLIHALYIRTITHWNATWKHPIEEFNDEINLQARLLREKLLSYARTLGQSGVTPSSA
jgi:hypothetical protein